jgi:putative transcriptional regulator
MMQADQGILLLAAAALPDPNFDHTVILLCDHDDAVGTFGLVLNHQTNMTMKEVLPDLKKWDAPLFRGGPVQLDSLHFLHGGSEFDPDAVEVADGIYWGRNFMDVLLALEDGRESPEHFRFFVGYSGWGEAQLARELQEESWYLAQANTDLVFAEDVKNQWRRAFRTLGPDYSILSNFPDSCMLN